MPSKYRLEHEYWREFEVTPSLDSKVSLEILADSWDEVAGYFYQYLIACGFVLTPEQMIDYLIEAHGLWDTYYGNKETDDGED